MQAIILAGGFGTRLSSVVTNTPKPMAPVSGRPFLCWLLEYMQEQGVREVVLCVHHLYEQIHDYFGERFGDIRLHYSIEDKPLGTGGAIKQAMQLLNPTQSVFALNGDSMVRLNYRLMMDSHQKKSRPLTLAAYHVDDCSRYSPLTVSDQQIEQFDLLGTATPGPVSVGFYVLAPDVFNGLDLPDAFSFERDFLAVHTPTLQPVAYDGVHYFLDIGVPHDYARAGKRYQL